MRKRRDVHMDRAEKERGVWREKEAHGEGEFAGTSERHSRTGMRYALLLL